MKIIEHAPWKYEVDEPQFPALTKNLSVDTVIIGGGLCGILSAYLLAKQGQQVVVLEKKKKIGHGATEYTTAFITQAVDTDFSELIDLFGTKFARLVWDSGASAIDLIEKIVNEEKIYCDFSRSPVFVYANSKKEYKELVEEQKIISEYGFDVERAVPGSGLGFENSGHLQLNNQAKFHPFKFLLGVAKKAEELGVKIFTESEVTKIYGDPVRVACNNHEVVSSNVIVATYQPFNSRIRLFLKRSMYKSYVFAVKIPKNLLKEGMYWDTGNPYHYFRVDNNRMIIGGEDIKSVVKMNDEKNFKALEEYLSMIMGPNKFEITHKWTGPILEPSDGLPLIGRIRDHEFVASAFSGNGMTYSAVAAIINSDLILGNENIIAKVYDPKRIPSLRQLFIKGKDYVEEFFGAAGKNILKKTRSSASM
jgi:glycine/D-amino acid oxidase-like deaminating enzyme